jgi:hypothetical protein
MQLSFIIISNTVDIAKVNVGLIFFLWMLMSTMIGTVPCRFQACGVLLKY